jgi:hypothetical protein
LGRITTATLSGFPCPHTPISNWHYFAVQCLLHIGAEGRQCLCLCLCSCVCLWCYTRMVDWLCHTNVPYVRINTTTPLESLDGAFFYRETVQLSASACEGKEKPEVPWVRLQCFHQNRRHPKPTQPRSSRPRDQSQGLHPHLAGLSAHKNSQKKSTSHTLIPLGILIYVSPLKTALISLPFQLRHTLVLTPFLGFAGDTFALTCR